MRLLNVEVDMLKDQITKDREGEGKFSVYFAPNDQQPFLLSFLAFIISLIALGVVLQK